MRMSGKSYFVIRSLTVEWVLAVKQIAKDSLLAYNNGNLSVKLWVTGILENQNRNLQIIINWRKDWTRVNVSLILHSEEICVGDDNTSACDEAAKIRVNLPADWFSIQILSNSERWRKTVSSTFAYILQLEWVFSIASSPTDYLIKWEQWGRREGSTSEVNKNIMTKNQVKGDNVVDECDQLFLLERPSPQAQQWQWQRQRSL